MFKSDPILLNDFQYHISWDWLIPVIDKIEKIDDDITYNVEFLMSKGDVEITAMDYQQVKGFGMSRLDCTYAVVGEFMKYFEVNLYEKTTQLITVKAESEDKAKEFACMLQLIHYLHGMEIWILESLRLKRYQKI